ncbi:sensor histidine kinase [Novosphingobium sp. KACC 22771]|uniref:sensor histidine kinase n=1 Tax=Novosphingobium sp. KACC 22771 TaxID=3025670 RepID=UPI0023665781|nr:ATP-binding protein [Novosphingobium sp. KACC 22771]WDF73101.1 ATP-binding protein [Novosphingobium sp. KACC 22771]
MPQMLEARNQFRSKLIGMIVLGFIALAGIVGSAAILMTMNQRQMEGVAHTYQVERQVSAMRLSLMRIDSFRRKKDTERSAEELKTYRSRLDAAIDSFGDLTKDNPRQQARVPLLEGLEAQVLLQVGAISKAEYGERVHFDEPIAMLDVLTKAMQDEELRLQGFRAGELRRIQYGFYVLLAAAGLLLIVVGLLTFASLRRFTQELMDSRQALRDANTGLEQAVQERTSDLKRANGELQRFAYIVSHDLRSPLVNVMGFTSELEVATKRLGEMLADARKTRPETLYPGTDELIEQDLPEAIHFIRTSTQKMDRLINAILQLSRQGNRTLNPTWLDMNRVISDVAESLKVRAEQADAQIIVAPNQPEIYGDRVAMEQILSNLIENAIKYNHPQRPPVVRITGRRIGQTAEFRVSDNGRGIDARDFDRVFDLFRRSGTQDRPGEGIGLAHVRAVVYRLGGSILLESELGVGTTFILSIPLHYSEEQSQVS